MERMGILKEVLETYRCESEPEAEALIQSAKDNQYEDQYELKDYTSQHKTKTKKGEVYDDFYIVKLKKIFNGEE